MRLYSPIVAVVPCGRSPFARCDGWAVGNATAEGEVVELLPGALVRVALDDGREVVAHLGGRFKLVAVRLLPGDRVRVEVTPYDAGRGRIVGKLAR